MKCHRCKKLRSFFDFINIYWDCLVIILVLLATITFYVLYKKNQTPSAAAIFSGLLTGCALLFIQLIFGVRQSYELFKQKKLRIKKILPYREGKDFYEELINDAVHSIDIAGTTISRFLTDFAHPSRTDSQALLDAVRRGVKIRFLIPKNLSESDELKARQSIIRTAEINRTSSVRIEIRRFNRDPAHSIFVSDEDCLIGPVFPNVASKDSPAIHTVKKSELAKPYLEYFNNEWENADQVEN